MKTKILFLSLCFAAFTICFGGCGSGEKKNEKKEPTTTTVAARYQCPMHPEVTSDKPGKCPKCGMDLEKVDNVKKDSTKK